MPVQFPNFLSVPVRTPDYSAIGDIFENYYKGKAMPKDDLIKAVQAEFARPTAEQALLSSRLSNRKSQMEIDQLARSIAEQKQIEEMFKNALAGGGQIQPSGMTANIPQQSQGMPMPAPQPQPAIDINAIMRNMTPIKPAMPEAVMRAFGSQPAQPQIPASVAQQAMQQPAQQTDQPMMRVGMPQAQAQDAMQSQPQSASVTEPTETVINEGQKNLYGIDLMYEQNPRAREYLEKRGFKKKEQIKTDSKTGRTTVMTQYPSGRVTVKTVGGIQSGDNLPLTSSMVTKHQKVIAGVDNVMPILQKILELSGGEITDKEGNPLGKNKDVLQPYPLSDGWSGGLGLIPTWMSDSANYESLVTSAAEPLVSALSYPGTNEGLEKAIKQVRTTHGERNYRYIKRIKDLMKELLEKKKYSQNALKKTGGMVLDNASSDQPQYSSSEYEEV